MQLPAIILNCKTYPHVDGDKALDMAMTCQDVHDETGASIIICPPTLELSRVADSVDIPVFAQNVDIWDGSVRTGAVTMTEVKAAGASGILINHSEARRRIADIEALVDTSGSHGLESVVCSNNIKTSRGVAAMGPDFVAMEPPELIGGDISVTSADPDIVKDTVRQVKEIDPDVKVLTGAGVKTREDVRAALDLGTSGVLLASGVVKAEDPRSVLMSLTQGLVQK